MQALQSFSHAFLYTFSLSGRSAMDSKERINLKFLVRLRKSPSQELKMNQQVTGDNIISRTFVFERLLCLKKVQRGSREDERWLKEREAFIKQRCTGKAGGIFWSSVNCSNNCKLDMKKDKRLEGSLRGFAHWTRGGYLKGTPCNLLFGIEINCLWHQSRYFKDVSRMHKPEIVLERYVRYSEVLR